MRNADCQSAILFQQSAISNQHSPINNHDATTVRSSASWVRHDQHIRDLQSSCSICHDPHGVSAAQGTTTNNAHLINLDLRFVTPSTSTGRLYFQQTSPGRGLCYLTCHGKDHNPFTY